MLLNVSSEQSGQCCFSGCRRPPGMYDSQSPTAPIGPHKFHRDPSQSRSLAVLEHALIASEQKGE